MKKWVGFLSGLACLLAVFSTVTRAEPLPADAKTLVIVGDSISAGHGIGAGEGWVDLFNHKVMEKGLQINVVNESISGEVTAGGLSRLPKILDRTQPTWIVIELGGNDGLRGLSPKVMEKNLETMVSLAQEKGVDVFLFGMKLPPNYGKQYNALFERTYRKVAEAKQVPLLPFFLDGVGGVEDYMQGDRIHPNGKAQETLAKNAWNFLAQYIGKKKGYQMSEIR